MLMVKVMRLHLIYKIGLAPPFYRLFFFFNFFFFFFFYCEEGNIFSVVWVEPCAKYDNVPWTFIYSTMDFPRLFYVFLFFFFFRFSSYVLKSSTLLLAFRHSKLVRAPKSYVLTMNLFLFFFYVTRFHIVEYIKFIKGF